MHRLIFAGIAVLTFLSTGRLVAADAVDFRFAPPEWQSSICLPDDPQKTLVDKSGELLYHYRKGGREFGTRIGVEVTPDAAWKKQELHSARVPIVRTFRESPGGLSVTEEAFAVTWLSTPASGPAPLRRIDAGGTLLNWAKPPSGAARSLADAAVHFNGAIQFEAATAKRGTARVAIALCEGWWDQAGKRIQTLRVEGAPLKTVDTVADIGKNRVAAFWFDARDVNGDGRIDISIEADAKTADKNVVLNGLWIFPPGTKNDDDSLLAGKMDAVAVARLATAAGGPARNDLILVRIANSGKEARTVHPKLIVGTKLGFSCQEQEAIVNGHETIVSSLKFAGPAEETGSRRAIPLGALTVAPGKPAEFFVLYCGGGTIVREPKTLEAAVAARDQAIQYWQSAPLPWGRIQVPDPKIQSLLDSAIRNIWQAREIKSGLPAFQVGPTCYRGLWIVDGAFLLEAATILGAGDQARNGVAYELTYQKPDGRIEVMKNFSKENGIVLWTCARHAQLTQDKDWLESIWPKLRGVAGHIRELRKETLANDSPLDDGLVPPGMPDGGIGGVHFEYTNVYWNLLGLHAWIEAARWLGKLDEANAWQKEYDDFQAAFRKAAARDLGKDSNGNAYLPTLMGEAGRKELPQRGQWAFCHAVYPGQIFDKQDPLVLGNLKMLEATGREGMVYGTGWDATGIWNYFASFYAHAWLWQGNGRKAAQSLYAFANHASPVLNWREEQSLLGEKFKKVGDMPHNWASAEFIRLAVHLLAIDRGDELHLFEGLPPEWTRPGMTTRLNGIATPFGPLTMELTISREGKSGRLKVEPLASAACKKIVVHLGGWASPDAAAIRELDPKRGCDCSIDWMASTNGRAVKPGGTDYAVVVSQATAADSKWNEVVQAVAAKHHARIVVYSGKVEQSLPALRELFPRYACFVARPEEEGRDFVVAVHRLTRRLDDDPYTDVMWGILTGYSAEDALRIAKADSPLTIRKAAAGAPLDLDPFDAGVWFSEGEKGVCFRKERGKTAQKETCPADSTRSLVDTLNNFRPDLFLTSGHATERDWQIGYSYRNGQFRCKDGVLLGVDLQNKAIPIRSPNPKVYLAAGNCLIGHISDRQAMALAWLGSGGANQMVGYVVPTWFGRGGWGTRDWLLNEPGRYTLSEAFFFNNQLLIHDLMQKLPEADRLKFDSFEKMSCPPELGKAVAPILERKGNGEVRECLGLLWDRDTVAFYGDPAWEARLAPRELPYDWKFSVTKNRHVLEMVAKRDCKPATPPAMWLPHRVWPAKIVEGQAMQPLVAGKFLIVTQPGELKQGKTYRVVFDAEPAENARSSH